MTDRGTVRVVVYFVGAAVILGGVATYLLAQRVLDQSAGAGTVDAAAVGIVAIPAGFTTTALGFLGGLLVSTRSAPTKEEIDEVLAPLAALPSPNVNIGPVTVGERPQDGEEGTSAPERRRRAPTAA